MTFVGARLNAVDHSLKYVEPLGGGRSVSLKSPHTITWLFSSLVRVLSIHADITARRYSWGLRLRGFGPELKKSVRRECNVSEPPLDSGGMYALMTDKGVLLIWKVRCTNSCEGQ